MKSFQGGERHDILLRGPDGSIATVPIIVTPRAGEVGTLGRQLALVNLGVSDADLDRVHARDIALAIVQLHARAVRLESGEVSQ